MRAADDTGKVIKIALLLVAYTAFKVFRRLTKGLSRYRSEALRREEAKKETAELF